MKQAKFANCPVCPLFPDRHTLVPSKAVEHPKLIVVGEGPGKDEAFSKSPFQGPSGRLLRATLERHGIDPLGEVTYTNATLCWPFGGDKERQLELATAACRGRLGYALSKWPDVPVLAVGKWAQKVLGLSTQERWEVEPLSGKVAIATHHPAYILRSETLDTAGPLFAQFDKVVHKATMGAKNWGGLEFLIEPEINPWSLPDINQNYGRITIDVETTGLQWYKDSIFLLGISTDKGDLWIFEGDILKSNEFIAWFQAFYAHHWQNIGGHNFKFDALFMRQQFGVLGRIGWDSMCMVNVVNEYWHKSLKELSTYYFDAEDYEERLVKAELRTIKRKQDRTYDKLNRQNLIEYLGLDLQYNHQLSYTLEGELVRLDKYYWPYLKHEIPQLNMLAQVEWDGFSVDFAQVKTEQHRMQTDIEQLHYQVTDLSQGHIQNPASPKQVSNYLFQVLKKPVVRRTSKGAASTAEDVLLEYQNDVPAIDALMAFRRVSKLKSSYLDNLAELSYTRAGVPLVSPDYQVARVVTHRLSATRPAIQTIPHSDTKKDTIPDWLAERMGQRFDGDYGTRIKNVYIARPGHVLITCDGKGWEMTGAAAASQDPFLCGLINQKVDVHGTVCDMVYGKGNWTKADRVKEKNIYFGWQYRGSVNAFVLETGLPREKVQEVVNFLNQNLTGLVAWQDRMLELAKTGKIDIPFFNYTIRFDILTDKILKDLPKVSVNYFVQGACSMIMCRAAYLAQEELALHGAKIVALVHDDYTIDVPVENSYRAACIMDRSVAEAGTQFNSNIKWLSEFKVGTRWGSLVELTLEKIKERYGE